MANAELRTPPEIRHATFNIPDAAEWRRAGASAFG
jgi:hypothetical protein